MSECKVTKNCSVARGLCFALCSGVISINAYLILSASKKVKAHKLLQETRRIKNAEEDAEV